MKKLIVKKLIANEGISIEEVDSLLSKENIEFQSIDVQNWKNFPYQPKVQFRIAYSNQEFFLQYRVKEKYLLAQCNLADDTCWPSNDSCVEFFVSPKSDSTYANFEFSCIGYCLFQNGKQGKERTRESLNVTQNVRRVSSLGSESFAQKEGEFEWLLTTAIPLSLLSNEAGESLSGKTWKANFYKCGDHLKEKHYLSWNPIDLPTPNFHCPTQFGTLLFE